MSHTSIITKIQNCITSNVSYHCMSKSDMVHHVKIKYPGVPDEIILDTILCLIDENILRVSFSVNAVNLYNTTRNQNLLQKICTYLIQMNYTSTYDELVSSFSLTDEQDIANALGILVAKNIIIQNDSQLILKLSNTS